MVGADVDGIRLGDTVKLVSTPHGLDKEDVCTKIDLDIENPEKSEYTFGLPMETLTDNNASATRKNKKSRCHYHRKNTVTCLCYVDLNVETTSLRYMTAAGNEAVANVVTNVTIGRRGEVEFEYLES